MNQSIKSFEIEVLNLIKRKIEQNNSTFNKFGIQANIQEIKRLNDNVKDGYTSEVEIDFSDLKGIFDVLEFFIYYKGSRDVDLEKLDEWLDENINDVVNQKK